MLDYRGICPQCLAEQSVRLVGEETCIECLHVFEVEPRAVDLIGGIAMMAASLAAERGAFLRISDGHVLFTSWYGDGRPAKKVAIDDVRGLIEIYQWLQRTTI